MNPRRFFPTATVTDSVYFPKTHGAWTMKRPFASRNCWTPVWRHANTSYNDKNTIQLEFNSRTQFNLEFNVKEIEYGPSQPALNLYLSMISETVWLPCTTAWLELRNAELSAAESLHDGWPGRLHCTWPWRPLSMWRRSRARSFYNNNQYHIIGSVTIIITITINYIVYTYIYIYIYTYLRRKQCGCLGSRVRIRGHRCSH